MRRKALHQLAKFYNIGNLVSYFVPFLNLRKLELFLGQTTARIWQLRSTLRSAAVPAAPAPAEIASEDGWID